MFGYICGGRPIETNINQIEPTKFVFTIPDAAKINHIAIFMIPGAQLPENLAAAVYAQLPGKEEFQFLGSLTQAKQSAIFKLNMGGASSLTNDVDAMMDEEDQASPEGSSVITFGISIEAIDVVNNYMAAQRLTASKTRKVLPSSTQPQNAPTAPGDISKLAGKIVSNAYNYLASFVDPQGKVPIKSFEEWWNKFQSKLTADPNYLNTLADA